MTALQLQCIPGPDLQGPEHDELVASPLRDRECPHGAGPPGPLPGGARLGPVRHRAAPPHRGRQVHPAADSSGALDLAKHYI